MEFYNNKQNDTLKFQINTEGADLNKVEARLIFSTGDNRNYLFFGKIQEDKCTFDIPELKIYEQGEKGHIKFEIISNDLYFPVWEENFEVKTKVNITLEKLISNVQTESNTPVKPKFSVSTPIKDTVKETKKEPEIVKEKNETKPEVKTKINQEKESEEIKNFSSFFNKKK